MKISLTVLKVVFFFALIIVKSTLTLFSFSLVAVYALLQGKGKAKNADLAFGSNMRILAINMTHISQYLLFN